MKTDKNGCSICPNSGERYETFHNQGKWYVQYDFRMNTGELFSCVCSTIEECRQRRDTWILYNIIYGKGFIKQGPTNEIGEEK